MDSLKAHLQSRRAEAADRDADVASLQQARHFPLLLCSPKVSIARTEDASIVRQDLDWICYSMDKPASNEARVE
jgi:hypothetical protein